MEVVHPGLNWKVVAAAHATAAWSRRMDVHRNARTSRHGRLLLIRRLPEGWSMAAVAAAMGVDARTVRKLRDRHAAEGEAGLAKRSSGPPHSPTRLDETAQAEIVALRRRRLSGPAIARGLGGPIAAVVLVLRWPDLNRLAALDPKPEVVRHQREQPGEL